MNLNFHTFQLTSLSQISLKAFQKSANLHPPLSVRVYESRGFVCVANLWCEGTEGTKCEKIERFKVN
ncbi:hypothetical protein DMC01_11040 [Campylobacter troglodytis]|nr:hypothetical protein DMC01_11040 [Campylobacter troglodytis]